MGNIKVNDATGTVMARLARPARRNSELGLQVRDDGAVVAYGVRRLLLDVTRAHNMNHADDTIVATVSIPADSILKLAEQLKAEAEQQAARVAYRAERIEENKRAGLPLLEGADENGFFPPRNDEGQGSQLPPTTSAPKTYANVAWGVEDVHAIRREREAIAFKRNLSVEEDGEIRWPSYPFGIEDYIDPDFEGSDWTDKQCEEYLSRVEKQVQEAMTTSGWEALEMFM